MDEANVYVAPPPGPVDQLQPHTVIAATGVG
jgi:hypothetical protein